MQAVAKSGTKCGASLQLRRPAPSALRPGPGPCVRTALLPRRAQPEQKEQAAAQQKRVEEELPPWVRREKEREMQAKSGAAGLPWGLYLLFSCFTGIAAVGSIFEFIDRNPVFGVIEPDSPLWAPILLTFAVTGIPMAGFLFVRGVNGFNEDAERQDKLDGYL